MDKLILKSIEAIKAGKTEYAIGLLEGALEMTGRGAQEVNKYPEEPKRIIPITPGIMESVAIIPMDEASILEAETRSKMKNLAPQIDV